MRAEAALVFAALQHGLASFVAGGAAMVAGAWADERVWGASSCHSDGPALGFAWGGMVLACMGSCAALCAAHGRSPFDLRFHGIVTVAMLAGEEAARSACVIAGWPASHLALAVGMAAGTAVGAAVAGLSGRAQALDRGAADHDVGDARLVELGQHRLLPALQRVGQRAAAVQAARRDAGPEALGHVEVRLQRAHDGADADLGGRAGELHAAAAAPKGRHETGGLEALHHLLDVRVRDAVAARDLLGPDPGLRGGGEQDEGAQAEVGVFGERHAVPR
jgi:hypothetical protein